MNTTTQTNTTDRMAEALLLLKGKTRDHLANGEAGDYVKAADGSLVEIVDWCGGRYAMYDYTSEFCGVTEDVDTAVEFLFESDEPSIVSLYGVPVSVTALKAELLNAYRSSLVNTSTEYLVMLDRPTEKLWTHSRRIGDTRIPRLHNNVPVYAFRDEGGDILLDWYWSNLFNSERNEAIESYADPDTWAGIVADAEDFGCEPWELALEDRDIRLHFRHEAADAFLTDRDGRESLECIYDIILEESEAWEKEAAR